MVSVQFEFNFQPKGLLERAFWEFHTNHPEVYYHLVDFAQQWRRRKGPEARLGVKALFERVRWELYLETLDDKPAPKLNNNHTAFYARLIMDRNPDLNDIFNLRQQRIQATFGPENEVLPVNEQVIDI